MTDANQYSLAISDDVAASITFQSDWALSIKRIPSTVVPEEVLHAKLLEEVDPRLATWKPKR